MKPNQLQVRLDEKTRLELDAFIAESPQTVEFDDGTTETVLLKRSEAVRILLRAALNQPTQRAKAAEILAFTASMQLRVLEHTRNELKILGIERVEPEARLSALSDEDTDESAD